MSIQSALVTVATVVVWYVLNITIIFTNRCLQTTGGLRAPVSLTLVHMIGSSIFANMAVFICGKTFKRQELSSRRQGFKVFVLAVTFAFSVVSGVAALAYIPVSFKEMIAATTPLFTAIIAFAAGEREDWSRSLALLMVAAGAVIATEGEPMWNGLGFFLGMAATVSRGLKTVLQHILLSSEEKLESMNLLRFMSMFAVAVLLPSVFIAEGPLLFINTVTSQLEAGNVEFLVWLCLNITSAFLVNLFQFFVTKCVGPTALQVLGNFKGVLCAFLSIIIFQNPVTLQSVGGYVLTTLGVFLYSYLKRIQPAKPSKQKIDISNSPEPTRRKAPIDASKLPLLPTASHV